MHLLFVVIKHVEIVSELLKELAEAGLHGGTIIESTGMASVLENMDDLPMFGMLRRILSDDDEKESSKTMFFVVNDEELVIAKKIIKEVTGGFNAPNTGIMFAVPVSYVEGLGE